jgi:hypothetical protein
MLFCVRQRGSGFLLEHKILYRVEDFATTVGEGWVAEWVGAWVGGRAGFKFARVKRGRRGGVELQKLITKNL